MASKQVYIPKETAPYYDYVEIEYEFNPGFSRTQKQRNIRNIHENFTRRFNGKQALEVSSKSMQNGGVELSAFNLLKYVPSKNEKYSVECVFQSGKVFEHGGPYIDLLDKTSKEAKKDDRLRNSGHLKQFTFEGENFSLKPETLFYDYIYINALLENPDLADILMEYDGFTDVEFNPKNSRNCQVKSCAAYVSLRKQGLLDKVKDSKSFKELYEPKVSPLIIKKEEARDEKPKIEFNINDKVKHNSFGDGVITKVDSKTICVTFENYGEKTIGIDWARNNLKKL